MSCRYLVDPEFHPTGKELQTPSRRARQDKARPWPTRCLNPQLTDQVDAASASEVLTDNSYSFIALRASNPALPIRLAAAFAIPLGAAVMKRRCARIPGQLAVGHISRPGSRPTQGRALAAITA